jgi:hypothetical protein
MLSLSSTNAVCCCRTISPAGASSGYSAVLTAASEVGEAAVQAAQVGLQDRSLKSSTNGMLFEVVLAHCCDSTCLQTCIDV